MLPLVITLAFVGITGPFAQTRVEPPSNKYEPSDDVKLGQQAAAEVRREFPILKDRDIDGFVDRIGQRLVGEVPQEYQHPEFRYAFDVVNARDINAFALPGGPMFVNRGMIEAAKNEGEVAGVMAHELAHVVLRHGTAQASKAQKYQLGQIAGAILGSIVGGKAGTVISEGSRFGLGAAFLRYGREYERQADLLGAQIMARAGYDPRYMASMFETIEKQSGPGGPEWLSSHPNPGNRSEYISEEARALQVDGQADTGMLPRVQAKLDDMPQAPTTKEITSKASAGRSGTPTGTSGRAGGPVDAPATSARRYNVGDLFEVAVPANWEELQGQDAVRFVPSGGYGRAGDQEVFTHGMEFGVTNAGQANLQEATRAFVAALSRSNPQLRPRGNAERAPFAGGDGMRVLLSQPSNVHGGQELVLLHTAQLDDGSLFYSIGVAPEREWSSYQRAFTRANNSVRLRR